MLKISLNENIKSKIYSYIDKMYYFFPIAFSFLFFYKLGDVSYWFDELVTVNTINPDTTKDFFSNYYRNELHPPLYFIFLKAFAKIMTLLTESAKLLWLVVNSYCNSAVALRFFAEDIPFIYQQYFTFYFPHKINNLSEISVRLLSALFMTGINLYIFNFFKKNSYMLVGLLACLFIGLNHKMIYFAQDARPYAMFAFLFLLVAAEFYAVFDKKIELENFKKLILFNILLAFTHYYGVFVILAQLLVLTAVNAKNRKLLVFSVLIFISYFTALNFVDEFFNLSRHTFLQADNPTVLRTIYRTIFQNFSVFMFSISIFLVAGKFLIKKNGKVEEIIIKSSVFLLSILIIIMATNSIRAIFYERYILFLIPLFAIIYTLILYSAAETITFWFKVRYLKWTAFIALYLFAGHRVVQLAYANTFYVTDYFQNGKYYPIKTAYQKITEDVHYKPSAAYVLEEYIPQYYLHYEKHYRTRAILNLNPNLLVEKKQQLLENIAVTENEKVIYYIRAKKSYLGEKNQGPLNLSGYSKHILYNKNSIILFKFVREN